MNQTEKVARWLFENEQERMDGDDWDSIQGRPLWEKVVQRYLAKAKGILSLIDQQGEPVVKSVGVIYGFDNGYPKVKWTDRYDLKSGTHLYLHPPASREVGDFEPWMVEFLEGNLYALPPSIRTKDARERWREVANARIAAAISRLFEEVER